MSKKIGLQIIQVTVFEIISILASVSFYCDHLSIYIVSVFKFFPVFSLSISFTESNHFSMSFSSSYWNVTGFYTSRKEYIMHIQLLVYFFAR